jgi:transcriptional regulator with XRE-family HTH domain
MSNLKSMREMAGLTQISLSRRSGVTRTRLSLAECNEAQLDETEKAAVRRVLLAALESRALQVQLALVSARSESSAEVSV